MPKAPKPLFHVEGNMIFQRPVRNGNSVAMGFAVCKVCAGVDPALVCAILNKGDPPAETDGVIS